jgi:hypothetical protein
MPDYSISPGQPKHGVLPGTTEIDSQEKHGNQMDVQPKPFGLTHPCNALLIYTGPSPRILFGIFSNSDSCDIVFTVVNIQLWKDALNVIFGGGMSKATFAQNAKTGLMKS